jgi:hypothetical protein
MMDLREMLDGLAEGDAHRGGIRCLRVWRVEPAFFARLGRDIRALRDSRPCSSVADPGHVTHWTGASGTVSQYSLLNRSGRTDDFSSDHDLSCRGKWFFDGAEFPHLARLIEAWPHLVNVRVNVLGPGARLAPHEEHVVFRTAAAGVGARLRFHLPVETNRDAELNLDGDVHHLPAGIVHLVNQGCVHAAVNGGADDRVHLVWDALLTRQVAARLLGAPPPDVGLPGGLAKAPVRRRDAVGAFRRMSPTVPEYESRHLALCPPQ